MLANWDNGGMNSVRRILWDDIKIIIEKSNILYYIKFMDGVD